MGEKRLVVGIADVIGKGIPAAIMMSMFRGTLRAYTDGGYSRHSMEEVTWKRSFTGSIDRQVSNAVTANLSPCLLRRLTSKPTR
ncbi:MAG: SpoIIE family protein phosphatase [Planctomycetota bacterium]